MNKHILLIIIGFAFIAITSHAQPLVVNTPTAGDFSEAFYAAGGNNSTTTDLTVSGNIDARDIKFMRDSLPVLSVINLEDATIRSYSGNGGTSAFTNFYPANEMPDYSFSIEVRINEYITEYQGKNSLTKVNLPNGLTSIGEWAFFQCAGLSYDLVIPNTVVTINNGAFIRCSGLTGELNIPGSVRTIGSQAFMGCGFTGRLEIPSTVKTINSGAFQNCEGFTGDLIIPNSITVIESQTFEYCIGLNGKLLLPNTLTKIEGNAFYHSSNFTGDIIIPDKVTTIDHDAFLGCSGFNGTLSIPKSVNAIIDRTFDECSNLKKIIINKAIPVEIFERALEEIDKASCELIVPTGAKTAYQAAIGWGLFENITEAIFVSLNAQNGYPLAPVTTTQSNSIIPEPENPVREGYTFAGWYKEIDCLNQWNFDTDIVTEPITLYAKWTVETNEETVTDIDGNIYNTVTIGEQVWMKENLRAIHYSDGTPIPLVEDSLQWANLGNNNTDKGRCWVLNDSITYAVQYGSLYTWAAAMNGVESSDSNPSGVQGACPTGWHLPSEDEWQELLDYVSDNVPENDVRYALIDTSYSNGTDLLGFKAKLCGYRYANAKRFQNVGSGTAFWSTTESNGGASYFTIFGGNPTIEEGCSTSTCYYTKSLGSSVRCLKDTPTGITTENEIEKPLVYPNPATNSLHIISNDHSNVSVNIFNLQGKQILFSPIISGTIDISSLPKGVYLVKVISGENSAITKLIKE